MADEQQNAVEADVARAAQSEAYNGLVSAAESALVAGDADAFKGLLSPNFVAVLDEATIDGVVQSQLIPFFSDFAEPGRTTYVTNTQDQFGSEGFAFYTSILTVGGEERPFVIYMVEENGRLVVANLLVNTTFEDMHEGRSPGDYD
jgi:hypothetical protein